eukprot:Clim_evm117s147 gene=Clim_evmTU117s147
MSGADLGLSMGLPGVPPAPSSPCPAKSTPNVSSDIETKEKTRKESNTLKAHIEAAWASSERSYASLRASPSEVYMVFMTKLLGSFSSFLVWYNLTSFLTEEFGFDDVAVGWIFALLGVAMSLGGILLGNFIDTHSVHTSLCIGAFFQVVSRAAFLFARTSFTVLFSLFLLLPLSEGFMWPVLAVAIRRYTPRPARTLSYGIFSAAMNLGAVLAGLLTTLFLTQFGCQDNGAAMDEAEIMGDTGALCPPEDTGVQIGHLHLSARRLIFLAATVASLLYTCFMFIGFRNIEVMGDYSIRPYQPKQRQMVSYTKRVLKEKNFWRLGVLVACLTMVRLIFRHLDATFPKYFKRAFKSEAWGAVISVTPGLVIFLAPSVALFTSHMDHYYIILAGAVVGAGSVFFLLLNTIPATVLFAIALAISEALYVPRLFDYAMTVTPKGEEGLYLQLANMPMFLAKLVVGPMGGYLLEAYCSPRPDDPTDYCPDPQRMWLYIGLLSATGPIALVIFKSFIMPPNYKEMLYAKEDCYGDALDSSATLSISSKADLADSTEVVDVASEPSVGTTSSDSVNQPSKAEDIYQ